MRRHHSRLDKCREPGPSFGAIAYSRSTGAVGWSYSFGLERAAKAAALANCARLAQDCEVIVSFHDTCAALVLRDMGKRGNCDRRLTQLSAAGRGGFRLASATRRL